MIYPETLKKAVQFASHTHKTQKRRILDYPYITHPLMVMFLVSKYTQNVDVLSAAVLHDVVEDTETRLSEIGERFGDRVMYLVDILSHDNSLEYNEKYKKYFDRIFHENDHDVLLIKSADILYNLTDIIETINFAGKKKFLTTFIHFADFIERQHVLIKRLQDSWVENPFLDDIIFYTQELEKLGEYEK